MIPYGSSTINGCECPANAPVNGTLIDGVIPSIDTTQQGWASELFTVNRNGQNPITIGFMFSSAFNLREIEIMLFHCPVLGIGITGVKVYSSFIFPAFISTASTLLFTLNSLPSDYYQSLSTVSVPIQPPMALSIYFVKFLFTGGVSVHHLNWLYVGEIRFSNEVISTTMILTITTSGTDNLRLDNL